MVWVPPSERQFEEKRLGISAVVILPLCYLENNSTGALFSSISGANELCELAEGIPSVPMMRTFQYPVVFAVLELYGNALDEEAVAFWTVCSHRMSLAPLATMAPIFLDGIGTCCTVGADGRCVYVCVFSDTLKYLSLKECDCSAGFALEDEPIFTQFLTSAG